MVQIRLRSTGTAKLLGNQFPTFRDKFLALTSVTELSNNRAWNLDTPLRQFKSRKWLHKLHFLQVQKSLNNMHVWVRYIYIYYIILIFFSCGAAAQSGPWPPHSWSFWIKYDSSEAVGLLWTSDQLVARDIYLTSHSTHNRYPCPRRDSNPQSQQTSGCRPTTQTARPVGPAYMNILAQILLDIS